MFSYAWNLTVSSEGNVQFIIPANLSSTARGTCSVNTSATCSSVSNLFNEMRPIFSNCWTHNVCTSKCFALRLGPSLSIMALALLLSVCPNFDFKLSCSLMFQQMFHVQCFDATFCDCRGLWLNWWLWHSCLSHRPLTYSEARATCQYSSRRWAPCLWIHGPICIHCHMDDVLQLGNPMEVQHKSLASFEVTRDPLQLCLWGCGASLMISFVLKAMSKRCSVI